MEAANGHKGVRVGPWVLGWGHGGGTHLMVELSGPAWD